MTAPTVPAAALSRSEKQQLLRRILLERIARPRTEPVSFAQERLWFLDRLHPGSAFYNLAYGFRLRGGLDRRALQAALGEVVRRHEPLRTTLQEREGAPVQVVLPFAGFALPVVDLWDVRETAREAEVRRQASAWAGRHFDLAAGPLFRAGLLRLGAEDHVLLLGLHHAVTDEWSMGVLFRELSALYDAFRDGRGSPLPEPPVRYADYVAHQREQLRGEALEGQLAYWRARLAGAPALLELPTDRPRPQVQSDRGAHERAVLARDLPERLRAAGRREGATLFMVVLGAFQAMLARYGGSEDVVVGSPVAGRTRREVEELIGFFVNTLVLRTDLAGDPTLRDVLRRARETTLGAHEHQEMPFDRLVAELQPERSLGHTPLFQVMFSQRDGDAAAPRLPGLRVDPLELAPDTAKFDLGLAFSERPDGLAVDVGYRTDLFDRGTIRRMLAHLGGVLEQFASRPDLRFSELEVLGEAERRVLVSDWNATAAEFPRGACIHQLFEAQAGRTPDAVAACCEGRTLTYAELDRRANRLAHHLAARGVGPEVRVAICAEPGLEMLEGVLAILKAGGAYVPLDPASPAPRLRMMLEDSGPALLLAHGVPADAVDALARAGGVPAIDLAADTAGWAGRPATNPCPAGLAPDHLAYVIYTSGSTGKPKGVMVPHRGVCNAIGAFAAAYRIGEGARVLFFAPLHFDASVLDVFTALCSGATLVVASREAMMPGENLLALLRGERVTHAKFTPSALAATPWAELPELGTVISTGEACGAEVVARWAPGRRFLNGYGPTETSVRVTALETADGTRPPPIGRPVRNVRLYVLDGWGSPVPVGVAGELYIGGVGVTRGYLGRPELTAERFVPDPFGGEAGGRLYRSGDRTRWNARGEVEFLGRMDDQVKIRGFRIEPGEVEAALAGLPGVREAAVVAREDAPGEKRLVGYVVPEAGGEVRAAELRRELQGRLPEYMVPGALVVLERLPLNPNGKLDRRALPAPGLAAADEAPAAPRTPVEAILAGVWAETLRLERVGVGQSFFELGGHSLLATRVVSRVRELFGVELPLRALLEDPTVAGLAERVDALRRAGVPALPPVVPVERTGPLPLSFAQERLWFIDRMRPGSATYNVPVALRLAGVLDAAALGRALGEIVRRHEALRTVFREADGSPVQVVAPFAGFALPAADLSGLGAPAREAEAGRLTREDAARPFDLERGPLLRPSLVRLADDEHLLLLCMHHVVSDGWSKEVLFRELSALYAAYRGGGESPLAELPVQYADYAAWQRRHLCGDALERQLAYWRERLAGAPALLELPADHPRPPVQSFRGASERLELPAAPAERLRALGRREGATLFTTVLGAFQALLSRYAGSEDVVVGSPIAGRTRGEVEGLIGFFVNTLVLRTDLSGDPTFREVVGRVREVTLGAYEHQELPFERLVAELQPERSLSHSPLFQVTLTVREGEEAEGGLAGLETRRVEAEAASAKYDLVLGVELGARGLRGELTYATELFERSTAERVLRHLARVLEQAAADPDRRIGELELLTAGERGQLVEEWGRAAGACRSERTLHALFEEQAARTPGAVAVVGGDRALTYRDLDRRANRVARDLVRRGVGPDVRVGVLLERSPELVVALLGILKAGGAYVPLDPEYPAGRLAFMLRDAAVPVLVTRERLRGRLPEHGAEVVCVDGTAGGDDRPPEVEVAPEHLAYVIYTSGSTGTPKGTEVPHRAVPGFFLGADYARFDERQVVLQHSSVSWDALTLELWPALLTGGRCVLFEGSGGDVPALAEAVRRHGVTTLWLTSALFSAVVDAAPDALAGVSQVMTGGEAVSAGHARRALQLYPGLRLVNGYGPSETTVFATCQVVAPGFVGTSLPIGRPVGDRRVYVLDARLEPVPAGVPGELFVGGPGVARGYLRRPELTAERFVPDPFSGEPGARMYRTGDRARRRPDGALEFAGRLDGQVKIRGFRVEPGEVEGSLAAHPAVREARVVVREDAPGEKRLVAYVVGEADPDALRAHLAERLPEYMVPAAFVALERLPLTPNGKLDARALPAPEPGRGGRCVAPRTPTEEVVAGIWAETLRQERVGVTESFFELGGHSLLATRAISRIQAVFSVDLPLRALFQAPTVAGLAERVDALRRAGVPALPPVVPVERTGPLPLSFAQERLWFIDRMQPGSATYNVPVALRLAGALDAAALGRALGEIVRRHEALRTVFREADGSPVQVVASFAGFVLAAADLSGLGAPAREAEAGRLATEEAARPFDLAAGPLFRAALVRLADDEHLLLLCMHHVVSDGWSMEVLFRELSVLYAAYRGGESSPLPELPVQYADYAAWQREQLEGEALDRQLAYWRERLADAPALLELPADHPRPPVQSFRGASERLELPASLAERLRALGRREGATLFMTVLGAWQVLLGRYAGSEDVVVGSPVAGRTRRETEELIGFFVNTLVLRTDLSGDPTFREVVGRVREATLGAYEHQELPFERLVAELQPERSLSHSPLFQVTLAVREGEEAEGGLAGLETRRVEAEAASAKYDLMLGVEVGARGLRGELTYATELFERSTAERVLRHLARVLGQVAEDADVPLSGIELLGAEERRQVVEEWNRTGAEPPAERCIHERFAEQAGRTPDAVAVVFEGEALSYAELDARANRLAHELRALGVRPEVRVGVCVERSLEMVVAVLAVLKAGGAYLPLDPAYPAARLAFMLEDAAVPVLLTQAQLEARLPRHAARVLRVDADAGSAAGTPDHAPAGLATPRNAAYVIYTSGSTGRPKGVVVEHRGVLNLLADFQARAPLRPGERCSVWTSLGFDVSVYEIFSPLLAGASLYVPGEALRLDGAAYLEWLAGQRIGGAYLPPFLLPEYRRRVEAHPGRACMGRLLVGVEPISESLLAGIRRSVPGVRVINGYGPTEATICSTLYDVPAEVRAERTAPIGRAVANTRAYVLDGSGHPCAVGVPGELHLGGVQLARGYLGDPRRTAERFVPDPLSGSAGERLYRTGDRVRWLAEGSLEFLGRLDQQVKVRGFRVEPGEIESVLTEEAAVERAVVVAREEASGRRLVAYVAGGAGLDAARLRERLRAKLPEHMVPGAIVVLERLPLTPGGKVDRGALPAPERGGEGAYVAPRTPLEEILCGIWAEVLDAETVGIHDNFFELGGHSLLAMQLVSRMRVLRVEVPVRQVFQSPTVAGLAEAIVRDESQPGATETIARMLLKLNSMSPEERAAALRAKQTGGAS